MKLLLTVGIGSDHLDLKAVAAAAAAGYNQVINGEWNVAGIAHRAYDLQGKNVGTVGAGRIGKLLLQRLKPFGCNMLYHDMVQMEQELEKEIGATFVENLDEMLPKCDVIVVNTPLTEKTSGEVWDLQPAPKEHPWRYMANQAMTPYISGTTIDD
ncbi:unnamed protein product [Cochlearia groenlandica]